MKIELGDEVRDNITGYQGVVVGLSEYAWQKKSIGVQSKIDKEGEMNDVYWFDYDRMDIIKKRKFSLKDSHPKLVNLGDEVCDVVSGFKGIAVERAMWLWGCNRVGIQPKIKKNNEKLKNLVWFDENSLKVTKKKVIEEKKEKTGGPPINIPTQNIK